MALREAKEPTSAEEDSSSTMALAEPGGANEREPLPPDVYFCPTREECLVLLDRWIGGDDDMADARGFIAQTNFYSASPDALRRRYPPAIARDGQHAWWFLSETKLQSTRTGGDTKRVDRRVETGGFWRPEQRSKEEPAAAEGDVGTCFAFYSGPSKKGMTPWRMQEFTSDKGKKKGAYALYRLYLSPRASEEELRAIYGEDGVPVGSERPARATVPAECFDAVAALLPPGSVRGGLGPQAGPDGSERPARATVPAECFDAVAAPLPPGSVRGGLGPQAGPDGSERPARATVPAECFDAVAAPLPPGSVRGGLGPQAGLDGSERPARATVPAECFDAVAALLPPGSVRGGLVPQASRQPDELTGLNKDD